MNGWDAMLAWLSDKGDTKWETAKAASRRLSAVYGHPADDSPRLHAFRWVDPLLRLGDVEFDSSNHTVVAVPPGIHVAKEFGRATLFGCWSDERLHAMRRANFDVDRIVLPEDHIGPSRWMLTLVDAEQLHHLQQLAEEIKVWCCVDSMLPMLRRLSKFDAMLEDLPQESGPIEGEWHRYDNADGKWKPVNSAMLQPGVYRRPSGAPPAFWINDRGICVGCRIPIIGVPRAGPHKRVINGSMTALQRV